MIEALDITGLVLAGGRGTRMGGVDKGLQPWRGTPLALHAARRLASQTLRVAISANRHLDVYEEFGFDVWPDADASSFDGPLAGFLTGLERCATSWVVTVPCDSPFFPTDLVARLAQGAANADVELAIIESGLPIPRSQPGFCLMHKALRPSLAAFMAAGGRKIDAWVRSQRFAAVHVEDDAPFANANTLDELNRLAALHARGTSPAS